MKSLGSFQRLAPRTHVARRVERKVESAIRELDEVILNAFAVGQPAWVNEIGRAKLARPRLLFAIHVDGNHARRTGEGGGVDTAQADAAAAKYGDRRAL